MHRDPHDELLLTHRPTTVITQATALLDAGPQPYGDQEDEANIFAGIGADESNTLLRGDVKPGTSIASKLPGLVAEADLQTPMPAPAQARPSIAPVVLVIGVLLGAMFLLGKRK